MLPKGTLFGDLRDELVAKLRDRGTVSPRVLKLLSSSKVDTEIARLGLDSLSRLEISVVASELCGAEFRPSDCENCQSLGEAFQVLKERG